MTFTYVVIVFTMRGVGVDLWRDEGIRFDYVQFQLKYEITWESILSLFKASVKGI